MLMVKRCVGKASHANLLACTFLSSPVRYLARSAASVSIKHQALPSCGYHGLREYTCSNHLSPKDGSCQANNASAST